MVAVGERGYLYPSSLLVTLVVGQLLSLIEVGFARRLVDFDKKSCAVADMTADAVAEKLLMPCRS